MVKKSLVSVVIVTRNRNEDLRVCLASIFKQTYKPFEIIVVDNGSEKEVKKSFQKKFPKVKFVRSEINLGGAGGRNLGLLNAKANMILFMDDDAEAHKEMIKELVKVLKRDKKNGIVQPKIYEMERKDVIQGVGHGINLKTGRVFGIGVHVKDEGQFEKVIKIPMAGCTWMVKKSVFEKIGDYDEDIFIPYEDSDFSQRAREVGFEVLYVPKAMVWHKGAKKTFVHPWLEWLGITTAERSFRVARNKIIFMKKHAKKGDFLFFMTFLVPLYAILHSLIILATGKVDILKNYWKGLLSGFDYTLLSTKHYLLSLVDPVCSVIDKSSKSILDVGCGRGMPMMVLKQRMKFKESVGVDLYQPYINECKRRKVHDKYFLCDVRDIPFKDKSFDVVMCLQVIEHLNKKDALKVVEKLESLSRKQVIISTPIGKTFHEAVDGNKLQLHKSGFLPEEFEERGYKVIKMGRKDIEGYANRLRNDLAKKFVYTLLFFVNMFLYIFQPLADHYMLVYK